MKTTLILITIVLTLPLISCSDNRESIAKTYLSQQLIGESKGALAMTAFKKTNGYKQKQDFSDYYVLEWEVQVTTSRGFWKQPVDFVDGFLWKNFRVLEESEVDKDIELILRTQKAQHFVKENVVKLNGKAYMIEKEKGWEVSHIATLQSQNIK